MAKKVGTLALAMEGDLSSAPRRFSLSIIKSILSSHISKVFYNLFLRISFLFLENQEIHCAFQVVGGNIVPEENEITAGDFGLRVRRAQEQ